MGRAILAVLAAVASVSTALAEPMDVLVAYTGKTLANIPAIEERVKLVEQLQNRIFANSGVQLTVHLHARLLDAVHEDAQVNDISRRSSFRKRSSALRRLLA